MQQSKQPVISIRATQCLLQDSLQPIQEGVHLSAIIKLHNITHTAWYRNSIPLMPVHKKSSSLPKITTSNSMFQWVIDLSGRMYRHTERCYESYETNMNILCYCYFLVFISVLCLCESHNGRMNMQYEQKRKTNH